MKLCFSEENVSYNRTENMTKGDIKDINMEECVHDCDCEGIDDDLKTMMTVGEKRHWRKRNPSISIVAPTIGIQPSLARNTTKKILIQKKCSCNFQN